MTFFYRNQGVSIKIIKVYPYTSVMFSKNGRVVFLIRDDFYTLPRENNCPLSVLPLHKLGPVKSMEATYEVYEHNPLGL